MESTNRDPQSQTVNPTHRGRSKGGRLFQLSSILLLFSATILVVALVLSLIFGNVPAENKYVDKNTIQAVFLNNGQFYFGNIVSLNDKYVRLTNVYYSPVDQQIQPNQSSTGALAQDISLVKLGCEPHGPTDLMLINRDQVSFWENVKTNSQVAKDVAGFKKNPNTQTCVVAKAN